MDGGRGRDPRVRRPGCGERRRLPPAVDGHLGARGRAARRPTSGCSSCSSPTGASAARVLRLLELTGVGPPTARAAPVAPALRGVLRAVAQTAGGRRPETRRTLAVRCRPPRPRRRSRRATRLDRLPALLRERILVLDGAMGTMVQRYRLSRGRLPRRALRRPPEGRPRQQRPAVPDPPDVVREIHAAYLAAGADIVSTNSFTATRIAQADYGLSDLAGEINEAAAAARARGRRRRRGRRRPPAVRGRLARARPTARGSISPDVNDPAARNVASPSWPRRTARPPRASRAAAPTSCSSRRSSTRSTPRPRSSRSRRRSRRSAAGIPVVISGTIVDASGRTLSGPDAGGVLDQHPARQPDARRAQLRARRQAAARARRRDEPPRRRAARRLPQRRPAQRARRLRRDAGPDRHGARRVGARGPDQPRRLVLRAARPSTRRRSRRPSPASRRASCRDPRHATRLAGLEPLVDPDARRRVRQHRRADQRHRLPPVRAPDAGDRRRGRRRTARRRRPRTTRSRSPATRSPTAP